jgi:hypothetical protein
MFVIVKCCVLFEVQTEFLNTVQTSFGFKGSSYSEQRPTHTTADKVKGVLYQFQ